MPFASAFVPRAVAVRVFARLWAGHCIGFSCGGSSLWGFKTRLALPVLVSLLRSCRPMVLSLRSWQLGCGMSRVSRLFFDCCGLPVSSIRLCYVRLPFVAYVSFGLCGTCLCLRCFFCPWVCGCFVAFLKFGASLFSLLDFSFRCQLAGGLFLQFLCSLVALASSHSCIWVRSCFCFREWWFVLPVFISRLG